MDGAGPKVLKMNVEERDKGWGIQTDFFLIESQLDSDTWRERK